MDGHLSPPAFTTDHFENAVRKMFFGGITYAVSTKHLDLGEREIAEIEALHERLAGFVNDQFAFLLRNARERADHQKRMAAIDCKVVSLGTDCLSRTLPTRWGLKLPKALGERTHPFDLAVHPYEAVCQVLADDFASYCEPSQLMVGGRNYVVHKRLKIQFNHEIGEAYAENNFSYFREIYERRVNNFRKDVANNPVLFVIHMTSNHVPTELYNILRLRLRRDDWRLLVLNTSADPYDAAAAAPQEMLLHHVPYPYPGYVWHTAPHYSSEAGQDFERRLVAILRQTIEDHFPRRA